jgi:hypothetical protein
MIQTFTQDDVIRYVYDETTQEENNHIEDAMMGDADLLMFYLDMVDVKQALNKVNLQPRQTSVDNILTFSKQFANSQPRLFSY